MRSYSTEAIILRRTNYGEADRIVSLLTPERGKISAIAKGVRRPKSKLAGGLELFALCDITIMEGRGELGVVTSSRMKQFFGNILKDYERMQFGYEAVKLIHRATETVTEIEFYELLHSVFGWLNDLSTMSTLSELCFRLRLQMLLGHGLNVVTDQAGRKLQADKRYHYNFSENAFFDDPQGRFTGDHIKLLRLAGIKNPQVLQRIAGIEPIIDDCVWLMRAAVT